MGIVKVLARVPRRRWLNRRERPNLFACCKPVRGSQAALGTAAAKAEWFARAPPAKVGSSKGYGVGVAACCCSPLYPPSEVPSGWLSLAMAREAARASESDHRAAERRSALVPGRVLFGQIRQLVSKTRLLASALKRANPDLPAECGPTKTTTLATLTRPGRCLCCFRCRIPGETVARNRLPTRTSSHFPIPSPANSSLMLLLFSEFQFSWRRLLRPIKAVRFGGAIARIQQLVPPTTTVRKSGRMAEQTTTTTT